MGSSGSIGMPGVRRIESSLTTRRAASASSAPSRRTSTGTAALRSRRPVKRMQPASRVPLPPFGWPSSASQTRPESLGTARNGYARWHGPERFHTGRGTAQRGTSPSAGATSRGVRRQSSRRTTSRRVFWRSARRGTCGRPVNSPKGSMTKLSTAVRLLDVGPSAIVPALFGHWLGKRVSLTVPSC
jgi:hypothetical protein